MPANLPAEAKHKWAEASAAKDPKLKLQLLKEFMSQVPKHKGTEKLRSQVKKKMAALRKEIEERKQRKVGKGGSRFFIEKEGAAQIAVIGPTNVGRSSLVASTSNADIRVSPSPYTTRRPEPGMFIYEDLQLQIVEAPPLMEGSADGKAWGLQTLTLARNADGLILMVDLSQDPVKQLSLIMNEIEKARIFATRPKARIEVEKKHMGSGLRVILLGKLVQCTIKDVKELLSSYRIADAVVKIHGEATIDEVEEAIFESTVHKPALIIANKIDLKESKTNLEKLEIHVDSQLPILPVSCKTRQGLKKLGEALFEILDIMRVYTKEPNVKEFSKRPFVLRRGATVHDLAKNIHSDFKERLSFAKVWSERLSFSPQKVGSTFILEDGDIVEIHMD